MSEAEGGSSGGGEQKEEKLEDKGFSQPVPAVPQYKMELPEQGHKENLYNLGDMIDAEYKDLYKEVAQIAIDDAAVDKEIEAQQGYLAALVAEMNAAAEARMKKIKEEDTATAEAESQKAIDEYFKRPMQQGAPSRVVGAKSTATERGREKVVDVDAPSSWGDLVYLSNRSEKPLRIDEIDEYLLLGEKEYVAPGYVEKPAKDAGINTYPIFQHPSVFKIKLTMAVIIGLLGGVLLIMLGYMFYHYVMQKKKNI